MSDNSPVALITGGAQRIGAAISHELHGRGYRIIVHYRKSEAAAQALCDELNRLRPDSARMAQANFTQFDDIDKLACSSLQCFGRIDALINNASDFYPTPVGEISLQDWDQLLSSNLRAPLFLSQALSAELKQREGCILNLVDIYAMRPLAQHTVYCAAKAALLMLTQSLAMELAPAVRVNGIAPGAILMPAEDSNFSQNEAHHIQQRVPLRRIGEPRDIARTAAFLVCDAPYITGQIIPVDGGRSLSQ